MTAEFAAPAADCVTKVSGAQRIYTYSLGESCPQAIRKR
jgi:hypothetical protein